MRAQFLLQLVPQETSYSFSVLLKPQAGSIRHTASCKLAWIKVVDEYRSGSRQGFRRLNLQGRSRMNEMLDAFRYRLSAIPAGSLRH